MAETKYSHSLRFIPFTVDDTRLEEGAQTLIGHLRPEWSQENIEFTVFKAGYMNSLVGCRRRDGLDPSDVILVRVYGRGTSLMIDREQEIKNVLALNAIGCAAPIYCRFDNGIACGYQPGHMLECDSVQQPEMQKLIIEELVKYHSTDMNSVCAAAGNGLQFDTRSPLFDYLHAWVNYIPDSWTDQQKQAKLNELGLTKQQLTSEVQQLESVVESLNSPIVFCHNDLTPHNIIYDEEKKMIHFIDFELVGYNYQACDIASHFCEYAGTVDIDFSRYPSRDYQLNWLRMYLESSLKYHGLDPDDVTDLDVERLFVQVQKFALVCHLGAVLWALLQSEHSSIDYVDYFDYACYRWTEYGARKLPFLALEMP